MVKKFTCIICPRGCSLTIDEAFLKDIKENVSMLIIQKLLKVRGIKGSL